MFTDLAALARDPRFIPHVYDYCDLLCVNCPAAPRCLLYAAEESACADGARSGPLTLEDGVRAGIEFARVVAEATGTAVARLDLCLSDPATAPREPALGHPVERLARHYAVQAARYLGAYSRDLGERRVVRDETAIDVIAWYHVMIATKIYRALAGEDRCLVEPALAEDVLGSAKIALLGIDRSLSAWRALGRGHPDDARIDGLVELLQTVRATVEEQFPGARAYRRPGLDG